jgi:hypothetical protein
LEISKFLRPPWPPATCVNTSSAFEFLHADIDAAQSFTVTANLTCAIAKGNTPTYLEYYIEVLTNNNGHEAPILLARRTYNATLPPVDTFTTTVYMN